MQSKNGLTQRSTKLAVGLMLVVLAPIQSHADEWRGHLATLAQAKKACSDLFSQSCQPYLAEAVAVADVLAAQAEAVTDDPKGFYFAVAFHGGTVARCPESWLKSLNGQELMTAALALPLQAAKWQPWTGALMQVARSGCHY